MVGDNRPEDRGPNGYPWCSACHRQEVKALVTLIGLPDRSVTTVNLCLDCALAYVGQAQDVVARHEWERRMNRPTAGCNCDSCLDLRSAERERRASEQAAT